ncbi:MAG: 16S rRNA (uracil(1498)-N(3))-methyltransferase [Gammaproteobacteria bacterium]
MRVPRVYLPVTLRPGISVELDADNSHHVRSVLRLKQGESLRLFNGSDSEYHAVLTGLGKKSVTLEVGQADPCNTESPLPIHFGLAISRGERMDFAIQKSVELGVSSITPLFTERCVVKLDPERAGHKQAHWQRIAVNASEQSGRARVPAIGKPGSYDSWLKSCRDLKIFLDPFATRSLDDLGETPRSVYLVSGPEGGFTPGERELAIQAGFLGIRLGSRILRAETAALVGIALIQARWGDLGSLIGIGEPDE